MPAITDAHEKDFCAFGAGLRTPGTARDHKKSAKWNYWMVWQFECAFCGSFAHVAEEGLSFCSCRLLHHLCPMTRGHPVC